MASDSLSTQDSSKRGPGFALLIILLAMLALSWLASLLADRAHRVFLTDHANIAAMNLHAHHLKKQADAILSRTNRDIANWRHSERLPATTPGTMAEPLKSRLRADIPELRAVQKSLLLYGDKLKAALAREESDKRWSTICFLTSRLLNVGTTIAIIFYFVMRFRKTMPSAKR